jgi:hypothetical protein
MHDWTSAMERMLNKKQCGTRDGLSADDIIGVSAMISGCRLLRFQVSGNP